MLLLQGGGSTRVYVDGLDTQSMALRLLDHDDETRSMARRLLDHDDETQSMARRLLDHDDVIAQMTSQMTADRSHLRAAVAGLTAGPTPGPTTAPTAPSAAPSGAPSAAPTYSLSVERHAGNSPQTLPDGKTLLRFTTNGQNSSFLVYSFAAPHPTIGVPAR